MSTNERSDKKLICPECGGSLGEVYAEANYGRVLLLDQCERCGGIWFDSWELYHLKDAEAKRLDAVNQDAILAATTGDRGGGLCPKCGNVHLKLFQDRNLPEDARINRCPGCNGLWLNRGELINYKKEKIKRSGGLAEDSKAHEESIAVDSRTAKLETANRLGAVLRARPEPDENTVSENLNMDRKELVADAVFLILQVLLKLIFRI